MKKRNKKIAFSAAILCISLLVVDPDKAVRSLMVPS